MVFVVAPDGSGGDDLADALAALPGFDPRVRHTAVFTHGIARLMGNYSVTKVADRVGGLSALVTDTTFLQATRRLVDDLLSTGDEPSHLIVEYTPSHAEQLLLAELLYPDATFVEVTGGRRRAVGRAWRTSRSLKAVVRAARASRRAQQATAEARRHLANPTRFLSVDAAKVASSSTDAAERIATTLGSSRPPAVAPFHPGPSPLADRAVFILGCFRSGTTWLEHLLLAHPFTCGLDGRESWVFEGLADLWSNITDGPLANAVGPEAGALAERRYIDTLLTGFRDETRRAATHVVEKSPVHTDHLSQLAAVYPEAWYVNIVRDGRDVVRSLIEVDDGTDAEAGARMWQRAVSNVQRDAPLLTRFREVRYEDVVNDPVGHATSLLHWIGLDVDDGVRAELEQRAGHHVSRRNTSGRPGAGKWRHELTDLQVETIERIAGAELHAYGYR
jgi:hypothetical protein